MRSRTARWCRTIPSSSSVGGGACGGGASCSCLSEWSKGVLRAHDIKPGNAMRQAHRAHLNCTESSRYTRIGGAHGKTLSRAFLDVEASQIPVELCACNSNCSSRGIEGSACTTSPSAPSSSCCWRHIYNKPARPVCWFRRDQGQGRCRQVKSWAKLPSQKLFGCSSSRGLLGLRVGSNLHPPTYHPATRRPSPIPGYRERVHSTWYAKSHESELEHSSTAYSISYTPD